jgi:serine/threonine protein kinase
VALLVQDTATQQGYVAKVMSLDRMPEKEQVRMRSEAECLGLCTHPNIIASRECIVAPAVLYLITEYGDGGDLAKELQLRKARGVYFQNAEIACVFAQLCLAVDHIHRKGILHRDIKPANIFFMRSGLVKLGDFGFSKRYDETLSNDVGRTVCGTPFYMSPEMWSGEKYSKKCDMWSMGVVLYELMALDRPFKGEGIKEVSVNIRSRRMEAIPVDRYDADLVGACLALLSADHSARPDIKDLLRLPLLQEGLRTVLRSLNENSTTTTTSDNTRDVLSAHIQSFLL